MLDRISSGTTIITYCFYMLYGQLSLLWILCKTRWQTENKRVEVIVGTSWTNISNNLSYLNNNVIKTYKIRNFVPLTLYITFFEFFLEFFRNNVGHFLLIFKFLSGQKPFSLGQYPILDRYCACMSVLIRTCFN